DVVADGRGCDGGAGASLPVLAARRRFSPPAVVLARDFLDSPCGWHSPQGAADPDVRRFDDSDAGLFRPLGGMALAASAGMGPDLDAGPRPAVVCRDFLASRRCIL